jgi:hypothetical protein
MPPLPRAVCPVCGSDSALRSGGELREHADARHPLYRVAGRAAEVPKCAASGLTVEEARSVKIDKVNGGAP